MNVEEFSERMDMICKEPERAKGKTVTHVVREPGALVVVLNDKTYFRVVGPGGDDDHLSYFYGISDPYTARDAGLITKDEFDELLKEGKEQELEEERKEFERLSKKFQSA